MHHLTSFARILYQVYSKTREQWFLLSFKIRFLGGEKNHRFSHLRVECGFWLSAFHSFEWMLHTLLFLGCQSNEAESLQIHYLESIFHDMKAREFPLLYSKNLDLQSMQIAIWFVGLVDLFGSLVLGIYYCDFWWCLVDLSFSWSLYNKGWMKYYSHQYGHHSYWNGHQFNACILYWLAIAVQNPALSRLLSAWVTWVLHQ